MTPAEYIAHVGLDLATAEYIHHLRHEQATARKWMREARGLTHVTPAGLARFDKSMLWWIDRAEASIWNMTMPPADREPTEDK